MYYYLLSLYGLWFIISFIYIFRPELLGKVRSALHRYGFFANWSMFVPKPNKVTHGYHLMFRDKDQNGNLEEWVEFHYPRWKPYLFLLNLGGRLNSIFNKCCRALVRLNFQRKEEVSQDSRFLYLCDIICCIPSNLYGASRQVVLKYQTMEGSEVIVAKSDFILL